MASETLTTMVLPTNGETIELELCPALQELRRIALDRQQDATMLPRVATLPIIDARTWSTRETGEDWLVWRARRVAERLRCMPIEILPGERVVGRPDFRDLTPEEQAECAEAARVLEAVPPYPGGDAGHFHPDYEKLFNVGVRGIRDEIAEHAARAETDEQRTFYQACDLAIAGLTDYARRVARRCQQLDAAADGPEARRWHELAAVCRHVATDPPRTFREAIQLMFLAEVALWHGEDHPLTTPGRMDQTLRPFYEADRAAGRLSPEQALELVSALYIQMNMILHPGSAVSVMVGGRDGRGRDATNELTYLCLIARQATRLVYPTVGVAWHAGAPGELTDFGCRMLATGIGDPAFFNDELIAQGLRDHGVSEADSYNYMNSTCVEIKVVGRSNMWVTAPYYNLAQALLDTMDRAVEGEPPTTFEAFDGLVRDRVATIVSDGAATLDERWRQRAVAGCFPLASCLVHDCLERGLDYDRGGARYNWVENSFVGLANLVDGLVAIRELVYERGELSLAELRDVVRADFKGHEPLRQRIVNRLPSYGADDDAADGLAVRWADFLAETTESNTVGPHRYVPGFFCWVMHERMGGQTGATPDGRQAGLPLADGAGAAQGREKAGPTASILSTTKWRHRKAIGGLVHNVRFAQDVLRTDAGLGAMRKLIETYMKRGGFEIQVNVTSAQTLRDAQTHPEQYPDLLVRVAGYSDYFVHLNANMQNEVISRTEHGLP